MSNIQRSGTRRRMGGIAAALSVTALAGAAGVVHRWGTDACAVRPVGVNFLNSAGQTGRFMLGSQPWPRRRDHSR